VVAHLLFQQYQTSIPSFVIVATALGVTERNVWPFFGTGTCKHHVCKQHQGCITSFGCKTPLTKGNKSKKKYSKDVFPLQMTLPP
jgi:hypothetical protein